MICWNIERINDLPAPMEAQNEGIIVKLQVNVHYALT